MVSDLLAKEGSVARVDNIDELIVYTEKQAQRDPDIAEEILLKYPGLTEEEVASLQSLIPNLPESYIEVARNVRLEGVSIGPLALWPRPFSKRFVEAVKKANYSPNNPYLPFYEKLGLVEVARLDSDPICLVRAGAEREGQVVCFDANYYPEVLPKPVAPDFESMMLLMGNALQIGISYEEKPEEAEQKYSQWLGGKSLELEMVSFWQNQLRELLIN